MPANAQNPAAFDYSFKLEFQNLAQDIPGTTAGLRLSDTLLTDTNILRGRCRFTPPVLNERQVALPNGGDGNIMLPMGLEPMTATAEIDGRVSDLLRLFEVDVDLLLYNVLAPAGKNSIPYRQEKREVGGVLRMVEESQLTTPESLGTMTLTIDPVYRYKVTVPTTAGIAAGSGAANNYEQAATVIIDINLQENRRIINGVDTLAAARSALGI